MRGGLHCQSALGRISIVHREYQPISYHPGQEDFSADQKTVLLIPLEGGSKDQRMLEWEICVTSDLIAVHLDMCCLLESTADAYQQ